MAVSKTRKTAAPKKLRPSTNSLLEQSPEITKAMAELRSKYGKYVVPIEELRSMMAEAMGDRTLTQELEDMREGR